MSENTSIVILGGGPAGAATALELARAGCQVLLLEKQPTPGWKIGETLPSEAVHHLFRLGVLEQFHRDQHLPCHGIVSIWGSSYPVEKDFIFNPNGPGWQLDRIKFESCLLNAALEAGCKIQYGSEVQKIERIDSGWLVQASEKLIEANWIVDCTGRHSKIATQERGGYEQIDSLVSIFAIAESSIGQDFDSRTYVESHPEGWCYTALMPNGKRTIAFQTDQDLLGQSNPNKFWLWERIQKCEWIWGLLKKNNYEFADSPRVAPAHSGRFRKCFGPNWIAVGDAAMSFDPLSGQGSAKAFESAFHAVQTILHQEDYQANCDQLWANFLVERQQIYSSETRWMNFPFWVRRHPFRTQ